MKSDAWLDALVREDVSPMPAADAQALRSRVTARMQAQRVALAAQGGPGVRRRAIATFAVAACVPFVVWGAASAVRAAGERRALAQGETVVTPRGSGAEVERAGAARALDAAERAFLTADDELRTGPGSTAHASLPTGAVVDVGPSARLRFERTGRPEAKGDRIELVAGKIDVQVPKLGPGDEVRVHTAGATVVVHGTRFSVEHAMPSAATHGAGATRVVVTEGRVSVTTPQGERILTGGSELLVPEPADASPVASDEGAAPAAPIVSSLQTPGPSAAVPVLSPSSTLAAENALLAEALRLRRDGKGERALVVLDELLDRYPRSPLAETARSERRGALDDLRAKGARP